MKGHGEEDLHEIVIIKRHQAEHEEGGHGGVWKIAYADFMTAMMAFFLVMWLINAANEETRSQVASYFNPVKLIDSRTNTKGLQDLESGADGKNKQEPVTGATKSDGKPDQKPVDRKSKEEALFKDPYKVLAEIAGPEDQGPQPQLPSPTDRQGRNGGQAFLDPFDPQTWQHTAEAAPIDHAPEKDQPAAATVQQETKADADLKLSTVPPANATSADMKLAAPSQQNAADAKPPEIKGAEPQQAAALDAEKPAKEASALKPSDMKSESSEAQQATGAAAEKPAQEAPNEHSPVTLKLSERSKDTPASTQRDARKIEKQIAAAIGKPEGDNAPHVEVKSTQEGVLISLTDSAHFGMFDIASAQPQPVLVRYLEKIGKILESQPGQVIISGHTDARPFRSETYDNWRLSSARAQMAYYMLVRGGVDEKRIERIEGHADHDLKVPGDPEAAENRRIEILLRETKS